eukprot:scaffold40561_cov72-Phaeocystis_antarctica.AAC.12
MATLKNSRPRRICLAVLAAYAWPAWRGQRIRADATCARTHPCHMQGIVTCTCLIGNLFRAIEYACSSLSGGHRGLCHCPLGHPGQSTPASTTAAHRKRLERSAYRRIPLIQQVADECELAAVW